MPWIVVVRRDVKNVTASWDVCGTSMEILSNDDSEFHVIIECKQQHRDRDRPPVGDAPGLPDDLTASWFPDGPTIELRSLNTPELDLDIRFIVCPSWCER
jgi:hypothetical protein